MKLVHGKGFTLLETLIAMFVLSLAITMAALMFHRSLDVLRVLDDKERTRQSARLALDRITSELREATSIVATGSSLRFVKIDPSAIAVPPPLAPAEPPDDFLPPAYTPLIAYPNSSRLRVTYSTDQEKLIREVGLLSQSPGSDFREVVVDGVNSLLCTPVPDNKGEVEIAVSVLDNRRLLSLSSRVLCPCIRESFQP